jgi:hypothetical protein
MMALPPNPAALDEDGKARVLAVFPGGGALRACGLSVAGSGVAEADACLGEEVVVHHIETFIAGC